MTSISQLSMEKWVLFYRVLVDVLDENILWFINISAELEVINFSNISFIKIFSNEDLEKLFLWWDQFQLFHYSSELLNCNVATVGPVIILELRLDQYTLLDNFNLDGLEQIQKNIEI